MKKQPLHAPVLLVLGLIMFSMYSCLKDRAPIPAPKPSLCDTMNVIFSKHIEADILWTHCAISSGCHAAGASYEMYDYNTLKPFAENGKLRDRVLDKKDMPTSGPLPDSLLQRLDCWLKNGYPNN